MIEWMELNDQFLIAVSNEKATMFRIHSIRGRIVEWIIHKIAPCIGGKGIIEFKLRRT